MNANDENAAEEGMEDNDEEENVVDNEKEDSAEENTNCLFSKRKCSGENS